MDNERKKRLAVDYSITVNSLALPDAYPLLRIEDLVNRVAQDKWYSSIDSTEAYLPPVENT